MKLNKTISARRHWANCHEELFQKEAQDESKHDMT